MRALVALAVVALLLPIAVVYLSPAPPASAAGPDPIPGNLWDATPPGVGNQDYLYVEGAVGDKQTQGSNTLFISDAFGAGDQYSDLGLLVNTGTEAWVGSFTSYPDRPNVEVGYYPVSIDKSVPGPLVPPFMTFVKLSVGECNKTVGWFAVDDIVRDGTIAVKLDLRLEQSCDDGPPIHAKIHIDRLSSTSTSTSTSTTSTTAAPTTTTTTAPPPPPHLSRPPGPPFGSLDLAAGAPGKVNVSGWAIDPDSASSIPVHVYVDSALTPLTADGSRPDVGAVFQGYGSAHGFSASLTAAPGSHQVCAYGINTGVGANALIGCRTVVVPGGSPFGSLDGVAARPGGVSLAGWAIDPDTASSIPVHVYVDSALTPLTADGPRPDVGAVYPGYGSAHGFSAQIAAAPGSHQVCAYGINTGVGANALIGCHTVVVPGGSPFGSLDLVSGAPGKVNVSGWAIDPDTASSIPVHVYVDSALTPLTANGNRPDVGAVYPGYGPSHGFSAQITATPGTHQVCVYGINTGVGANAPFGCRSVTVS